MPRRQDYSGADQARFRGYISPERWQQMARYGMGEDVAFPTYQEIAHKQSIGKDDARFIEDFLSMLYEQEDAKRFQKFGKTKLYTGDPLLGEAGRLAGGG